MSWYKVVVGAVAALMLSGCGIMGYERFAAYEVEVRVVAEGAPVAGAQISYQGEQATTDADGRATLRYMVRGIKVVTVSATGWMTVQQRLAVPVLQPGIIDVELEQPMQGISEFPGMATN